MLRTSVLATAVVGSMAFSPAFVPQGPGLRTVAKSPLSPPNAACAPRQRAGVALEMAFSFGKKKEPERKAPWGDENPYRIFGVTEDAPYEEVEQAYKDLVAENEGNEKYCMQLEMMKEKIFDDRLYARMAGSLKAKVAESPFDRKFVEKKDPWYSKIAWLAKIVRMPKQKYAIQVSILMSCFIVAGIFAPQLASTTMGFGFLSAMGFLYNRGTPDVVRDDMGNPGESRPANYAALGKTLVICLLFAGMGFSFGQVLITSAALPAMMQPDAVINTFFNVGLWVSAMFFQVQDEE
mmetsp:Transcript_22363/g.55920  ORF Transcript_22363/g.55920 Transcript_22363/m.55920 type:complete len:293 (-) Transcript_22363:63-941(-)|eukprot:CAMPEP_0173433218 /NCGR_PEP_ID=MMETSP1357-20121228/10745_1 /TAXON_ID=77926 /ORGANISM="Hemiselmis rufescens, Strain PCC563" /LENGTH=292 /DNA_ID=CAMNT_0014397905 /DNA_START=56 /DNA_END=934 /DNA_ORIENTATION=+